MDKCKVLYVDDEVNNLTSFKATFRRDFQIFLAESGAEGQELLKKERIEVIITDQRMPGMTGVEFLESIIDEYPDAVRILLTGYTDINAVIDAINKGQVYHYLTKPWDERYLRTVINNAHEIYKLRLQNKLMMDKLKLSNEQLEFMLRQELLS
jgi:response regulator RpfG family c-di-GMP phosphodiesterase